MSHPLPWQFAKGRRERKRDSEDCALPCISEKWRFPQTLKSPQWNNSAPRFPSLLISWPAIQERRQVEPSSQLGLQGPVLRSHLLSFSCFSLNQSSHPWRRKWQPTPVFLPGKSHGQRSLAGYSSRGHKESDTTEQLNSKTLRYFTLKHGGVCTVSLFSFCIWKPVSSPRRRGNRTGGVSGVGWQPSVFSKNLKIKKKKPTKNKQTKKTKFTPLHLQKNFNLIGRSFLCFCPLRDSKWAYDLLC